MNNSLHELACAFADEAVRRAEVEDSRSKDSGRAEFVWDLAYDAFLWRTQPTLPLSSKPSTSSTSGGSPALVMPIGGKL